VQDACESAGQFPQGTAHPDEPVRAQNREQRKTTDMSHATTPIGETVTDNEVTATFTEDELIKLKVERAKEDLQIQEDLAVKQEEAKAAYVGDEPLKVTPEELKKINTIQLSERAADETLEIALSNHSQTTLKVMRARQKWWFQVAERLGLNLEDLKVSVNEHTGVLTIRPRRQDEYED
jgi:hypothetical protein